MDRYVYDGPVKVFDILRSSNWHGETMADSVAKAHSNLTYQYKRQNNLVVGTRVSLPGRIRKEN